ncbi:hypothetical protein Avbf_06581 [Armadillidium vulgare]|nr:hypothetical protein Avbf_06581 [Armadillidium vulgare]
MFQAYILTQSLSYIQISEQKPLTQFGPGLFSVNSGTVLDLLSRKFLMKSLSIRISNKKEKGYEYHNAEKFFFLQFRLNPQNQNYITPSPRSYQYLVNRK